MNPTPDSPDGIREQLAVIEHARWADWQSWIHECGSMDWNQEGEQVLTIPLEYVERWERQIKTPYAELSEGKKLSDMQQVDRYWPLIEQLVLDARTSGYAEAVADMSLKNTTRRQMDMLRDMKSGVFSTYYDYAKRKGISHQAAQQTHAVLVEKGLVNPTLTAHRKALGSGE